MRELCVPKGVSIRNRRTLTHNLTHKKASVAACALLVVASISSLAQEQRPALVPLSTGSGSTGSPNLSSGIGELTDQPIGPGAVVHISVFNAPDFSGTSRVSESGDVAVPVVGAVHIEGLNSQKASDLIVSELTSRNLVLEPHVVVTVETSASGITILGEVRSPGIYPLPGKHLLSDMLATAGGLTGNTGRVIEISNNHTPDQKVDLPWDPTMHNTTNYDRPVNPGDRILVKGCGIAYIGGHVAKPGAYSLCGSQQITMSEAIALAGGIVAYTSERHSYLIRTGPDGARTVQEIDLHKILRAQTADPVVKEDDIVYVTPSGIKLALDRAVSFALAVSTSLIYTYHP
jgi:polysaccharide biosynthesis/export protein